MPYTSAWQLLEKIKTVNPRVFISTLAFEEFLVQVFKKGLEKDLATYEDFITGGGSFVVVDISRQVARKAAKIRAEFNIKAPDAIHLATALKSASKIFVTTDKRLPRKIDKLVVEYLA